MRLLLDENITPKAKEILEQLGNDVQSVHSLAKLGSNDFEILEEAIKLDRALITHNGKDFIIQIPPKTKNIKHGGLLWLKHQMTRGNAKELCEKMNSFFIKVGSLADAIWILKKLDRELIFKKHYPTN